MRHHVRRRERNEIKDSKCYSWLVSIRHIIPFIVFLSIHMKVGDISMTNMRLALMCRFIKLMPLKKLIFTKNLCFWRKQRVALHSPI
jgi:hypothetical protein